MLYYRLSVIGCGRRALPGGVAVLRAAAGRWRPGGGIPHIDELGARPVGRHAGSAGVPGQ